MRTALDTNVLSSLWSGEAAAVDVAQRLGTASQDGSLVLSGVVFAELIASPRTTESFVQSYLLQRNIDRDFLLPEEVWAEAGRRFGRYASRRKQSAGGESKRLLADFLVGAHALLRADRLMTLDPKRYQQDFPELRLYPVVM